MFSTVSCQEDPRTPTLPMYQKMVSTFEITTCKNERFFEKILDVNKILRVNNELWVLDPGGKKERSTIEERLTLVILKQDFSFWLVPWFSSAWC